MDAIIISLLNLMEHIQNYDDFYGCCQETESRKAHSKRMIDLFDSETTPTALTVVSRGSLICYPDIYFFARDGLIPNDHTK